VTAFSISLWSRIAEVVGTRFSLPVVAGASQPAQAGVPKSSRLCFSRATPAAALSLAILLAGCAAARPASYYQLTVPTENAAADPPPNAFPITIIMGPLSASHLYREDRIVYSSNDEAMGMYEYQRWVEPPPEMIQDVLFRSLRSSGRYRAVHTQRSNIRGDYLLHGHLYDFKEMSGPKMSARLSLDLELRDTKTGETVWNHLYNHDEPVTGKNVSSVVAALNRNVQRATNEFTASLVQYFSAHPPTPQEPPPQ
jgi:ABC-type uncharacterized transport system auxiliary subunit